MKSRKVKAAAKGKAYISKKKLKGNLSLVVSDSGSDVDSDSFYHDDIDNFHKKQDDELSTDDELIQHKEDSSEEEEVLPITDDEKEDSDESDEHAEKDLPNPEAWGRKKSVYYNADFVDEDRGRTYREEDAEAAKAEAEEAFAIQKSVLSNINADHLGANLFLEGSSESSDNEEREKDEGNLASAPKHEKIKFLRKTCSEMFDFFVDFKRSMQEIKDILLPLLELAYKGKLPLEAHAKYIKLKYQLLLHYSMNISFYMTLKSSGQKVSHHPVLQKISFFKKLLGQMKCIDDAIKVNNEIILKKCKNNEEITLADSKDDENAIASHTQSVSKNSATNLVPKDENLKVKKFKRKHIETETEKEIMSFINEIKEQRKKRKVKSDDDVSEDKDEPVPDENDEKGVEEKRTITYQIAKNKGLVPHRKKEYRNPRVRHRMKFRKAKIRRKGQVREVIKEVKRYEGEPTGISTHVVKSIKLK